METVSIRDLRGTSLREKTRSGKLLAITNRGALIGVVVPVAAAWLEHLIDYNLSHVQQSIAEAEQTMADGKSMATLGDAIGQLQGMLNPVSGRAGPGGSYARTVRIGELTAKLIEQTGSAGRTLAVTHDRELIAIVIPVTRNLVEFLLEQNMSRVLYNVGLAEMEIETTHPMTSLESLAGGRMEIEDNEAEPIFSRDTAPEVS